MGDHHRQRRVGVARSATRGFFPGVGSTSWPQIAEGGGFCVNVLTASQDELCWRFAKEPTDGTDRFDGIPSHLSSSGMPVLDGTLARSIVRSNR
ncbi:MAG: flavin reductase [Actinobacteria bacterium]|nr:flavin reductase [Actinomycetota bacterium]